MAVQNNPMQITKIKDQQTNRVLYLIWHGDEMNH